MTVPISADRSALPSPTRFSTATRLSVHTLAVYIMAWGYFVGLSNTGFDQWVRTQTGGHLQFLTIQGLVLAGLTMVLATVTDVLPLVHLKQTKRLLSMIALPLECTISIIYWSLILLAPDLIMPTSQSEGEPSSAAPIPFQLDISVDLALHAVPAFALALDFLLFERKFSKVEMTRIAPVLAAAMAFWYGSWVEYCATRNDGIFPYPFLTFNSFPTRVAIYGGATSLALASLWVINPLHAKDGGSVRTRNVE